jgi:hypothetical protein
LLSYGPVGDDTGVEIPIGLVFNKYVYPGEGSVEFRDCGFDGLCGTSIKDDGVWDLPIRGDYRTPFGVQRWHSNYNFLWTGTSIELIPPTTIRPGRTYQITIPVAAVMDGAGNVFAGLTWRFSTGTRAFQPHGWRISNSNTPYGSKTSNTRRGEGWKVRELKWYKDAACTDPLEGTPAASRNLVLETFSNYSKVPHKSDPRLAFDDDPNTWWTSVPNPIQDIQMCQNFVDGERSCDTPGDWLGIYLEKREEVTTVARCVHVDQMPGSESEFTIQVLHNDKWYNMIEEINTTAPFPFPIDTLYLFFE